MQHLIRDGLERPIQSLSAEALGALVADAPPFDGLQGFALAHAVCAATSPDTIGLSIVGSSLGFTQLHACCHACRTLVAASTPAPPTVAPAQWWLALAHAMIAVHPDTFRLTETDINLLALEAAIAVFMDAIAMAILVHAPTAEPALDGLITPLDDDGDPLVLTH